MVANSDNANVQADVVNTTEANLSEEVKAYNQAMDIIKNRYPEEPWYSWYFKQIY